MRPNLHNLAAGVACLIVIVINSLALGLPSRVAAAPTGEAANTTAKPTASPVAPTALPASAASPTRYTFSWPLDGTRPPPRGGTTRGVPVVLDDAPSLAWQALQQPALTDLERDRRAILAMAGTYRVSFDFLEVASYAAAGAPPVPYQSWGTEKVYVDEDTPGRISLVHILEMRILGADGRPSEPMVTKHWRQDWRYEPTEIVEYLGRDRWQRRTLGDAERRGRWSQSVHQVDESPRYAALGRWQHTASFSSWLGGETWRPLPRREWSVRRDYQALVGTNRHTVLPTGWLQEENNLKAVLTAPGTVDPVRPYLGREYGLARYERLREGGFEAADRYHERTHAFWDRVRDGWSARFAEQSVVTLRGPVDQLGLYGPLFERADRIAEGDTPGGDEASWIRSVIDGMGAAP